MGGKTAIAAGLLMGVLAGTGVLAAALYLAPDVTTSGGPTPVPTAPPASATASPGGPVAGSPPVTASPPSSGSASPGAGGSPPAGPSTSPAGPSANGSPATGLFGVGEPAPALSVPQLGGGTIDLSALRGKPVWVNFMATWCLPCRDELPVMAGFAVRYQAQGLVVVPVDVREDDAAVKAFMSSLGVSFSTGLDRDGTAQAAWGALALPVHFWIDADGIVRDGALGEIGPDIMAHGLQAILPGVEVTP
jgi:cytochrome c biogenesis protein CcmG, thiol:disulfide interchange protein DsbE